MIDQQKPHLAFVHASWHADIVQQALAGFRSVVEDSATYEVCSVPGAFELPLHVRLLAQSGRFDGVIAAALVVDGGIYRHEFVANAVVNGLMQVQLETGVPVFSSVLTPHQFRGDGTVDGFFHAHMNGKGQEVAQACLATLNARADLAVSA